MPLNISRNDIRYSRSDALVCPTDRGFSHGGGVDKIVHELAGSELDQRCKELSPLEEGQAVYTEPYGFTNYRYIIHVRGPVYIDGQHDEEELLRKSYENCLKIAKELSLESITFPLISSGTFGFPKGEALRIATDVITAFLEDEEMDIDLLVYDKNELSVSNILRNDLKAYLFRNAPVEELSMRSIGNTPLDARHSAGERRSYSKPGGIFERVSSIVENAVFNDLEEKKEINAEKIDEDSFESIDIGSLFEEEIGLPGSLKEATFKPDQSFGDYLIDLIDERKLKDSEVYKKANVNRDVFNKIINNKVRSPKKKTCIALAIGLKLDLDETNELLKKAGYVLSNSFVFDKIIAYCIENDIYNIFDVNQLLLDNDQETMC